jgi:hypothetical protein
MLILQDRKKRRPWNSCNADRFLDLYSAEALQHSILKGKAPSFTQ